MIYDYHVHTNYSFDSRAVMSDVCAEAVERGLQEICFTEHYAVNPVLPTYGHLDFTQYFAEIERCKQQYEGKLIIKAGIELCEPHYMQTQYEEALAHQPLDFILGSVHNMNERKLRLFLAQEGIDHYELYFREVLHMVQHADIDIIAHLDLLKRYAVGNIGNYKLSDYEDVIEAILQTAITRHIGIEINTSGWRGGAGEPFPSREVLQLYRQMGGELLTIGSDSHFVEHTGAEISDAIQLAKECGFKAIYTYNQRQPQAVALDEYYFDKK